MGESVEHGQSASPGRKKLNHTLRLFGNAKTGDGEAPPIETLIPTGELDVNRHLAVPESARAAVEVISGAVATIAPPTAIFLRRFRRSLRPGPTGDM